MTRRASLTALAGMLVTCGYLFAQAPAPYDLVIRNGRVIDGTGSPWYRADVAVRGDTIALIAPAISAPAARVIDANGQIVSPGFIDIHNHARENFFRLPSADNYIRQGVTTLIEGPDGGSPVPLGPFLDKLDATQKSINIGSFIGQGSVREAVLGAANRRPTPAELDKMRGIVEDAMKAGAFGMSTGLFYVPGAFTPIEEVIELAKVAGKYGGIHISHMRDEAFGVLESVRETIRIGEEGGLPTQITHHKIIGPKNYGKSVETLKLLDAARMRGVDTTSDQYPYTASSNNLTAGLIPQWATGRRPPADAGSTEESCDAQGDRRRSCANDSRRARRRRSQEHLPRPLRLRRVDGGKESRRRRAHARPGADRSRTGPRRPCGSSSRGSARLCITR